MFEFLWQSIRHCDGVFCGLSSLENNLRSSGLPDEVLVVAWDEFGRTPKVNGKGGRDYWPVRLPQLCLAVAFLLVKVIEATDKITG